MIVVVCLKNKEIIYRYMDNKIKQRDFGRSRLGNPKLTRHIKIPNEWRERILKIDNRCRISIDEKAEYDNKAWYNKLVSNKPKDK